MPTLNHPDHCKHRWTLHKTLYEITYKSKYDNKEIKCFEQNSPIAKEMSNEELKNATKIYEYFCWNCWCLMRIDAKSVEKIMEKGYSIDNVPNHPAI